MRLHFPSPAVGKVPKLHERRWLGPAGSEPEGYRVTYYVSGGPRVMVMGAPYLWAPSSCHVLKNERIQHYTPAEALECWRVRRRRFDLPEQWDYVDGCGVGEISS